MHVFDKKTISKVIAKVESARDTELISFGYLTSGSHGEGHFSKIYIKNHKETNSIDAIYAKASVTMKNSPDLTLVQITGEETGESYTVIKKSEHMPSKKEIACDIGALEMLALTTFADMLNVDPFKPSIDIQDIILTGFAAAGETKAPAKKESTIGSLVDGLSKILGKFGSWADLISKLPPLNKTSSSITKWINNRGFEDFQESSQFIRDEGIPHK